MIKCIMSDLDGTLLNSKKEIDSRSLAALQRAGKGRTVVLISGRHFSEIKEYIQSLSALDRLYAVSCDGQYLHERDGSLIWENSFLNEDSVRDIFSTLKVRRITLCMEARTVCAVAGKADRAALMLKRKLLGLHGTDIVSMDRADALKDCERIEKLILHGALSGGQLEELSGKYCVHNFSDRCEILHPAVNKYAAAAVLCERCGIDSGEVLYFGDDVNDIECFDSFKNSVAMGNAVEIIKQKAARVSLSNDEAGIACILEELEAF